MTDKELEKLGKSFLREAEAFGQRMARSMVGFPALHRAVPEDFANGQTVYPPLSDELPPEAFMLPSFRYVTTHYEAIVEFTFLGAVDEVIWERARREALLLGVTLVRVGFGMGGDRHAGILHLETKGQIDSVVNLMRAAEVMLQTLTETEITKLTLTGV